MSVPGAKPAPDGCRRRREARRSVHSAKLTRCTRSAPSPSLSSPPSLPLHIPPVRTGPISSTRRRALRTHSRPTKLVGILVTATSPPSLGCPRGCVVALSQRGGGVQTRQHETAVWLRVIQRVQRCIRCPAGWGGEALSSYRSKQTPTTPSVLRNNVSQY